MFQRLSNMLIEFVDPVVDYGDLMSTLLDFDAISALFRGGFHVAFDAMHSGDVVKSRKKMRPEGKLIG